MIRPLELFIGLRYTRAKRRNHFISFVAAASIIGIAVGVWALITVLSVMNGFEKEMRASILGVASHATVSAGREGLADWRGVAERVSSHPQVVGHAPYILGQGMLVNRGVVSGSLIRGILPAAEARVSEIDGKMVTGRLANLKAGEFGIVVGSELAWKLDLRIGSRVALVSPQGQSSPAGLLPRLKRFTVVGIFEMGMYEYDSGLAMIHLDDAAKLYRTQNRITGLRLKLQDIYTAPRVALELAETLGFDYNLRDWTKDHANFFRALKIERTVMFIILCLIIAVAAINIVSTLVIVVTDKRAEIAILRTLGVSPLSVMAIFVVQGVVIGVFGTALGGVMGVLTALNIETLVPFIENLLGFRILDPSVYQISDVPSELRWSDVSRVTGAAFAISLLATLYPAWRGARTQPAEALRYE